MEIAILSGNTLKLKSKNSTILVDPTASIAKTPADCVLVLDKAAPIDASRVEESRVVISGSGEYEVGGVKISGLGVEGETVYVVDLDGISTVVGKSSALTKLLPKLTESGAVVINADDSFNTSILSTLGSTIVVFYGPNKIEALKSIGKETVPVVSKYLAKRDSLPQETEVISLG